MRGLPCSKVIKTARSSLFCKMRSNHLRIRAARSLPVILFHLVRAWSAAAMAFSASATLKLVTSAMISPVAGLLTWKEVFELDWTHSLSIKASSLKRLGSFRRLRISIFCMMSFSDQKGVCTIHNDFIPRSKKAPQAITWGAHIAYKDN